jgi:3-hydroxybutyryl-CoA dehydrogenase
MTFRTIAVVGAGTMGNGIAQVCAAAGLAVVMIDISDEALQRSRATIAKNLDRLVAKDKLDTAGREAVLGRIQCAVDYSGMAGADLVIEAATENESLKLRILGQIDAALGPQAVIATNTSSMSVTRLAAATQRHDRFIGLHFFNPVPVMALVEVVRGLRTSDATLAAAQDFVQAIGKTAIVARNSPGFAVNRVLCPMINEAIYALQEGLASAEDIDTGMRLGCNHPIGPLALADLIGLDTMLSVMEMFYAGFNDPKYRPAPLLKEMVDAGYLGRKSGQGFYAY